MKKKPKFLLLGWDAADGKVINPLIDKGQMPALESIINKGCMGKSVGFFYSSSFLH